ncbi:MAG: hypothetical protein Q9167_004929 [Letrouitia subvulpina]
MSEYWKSTPKYWCKHCKTYVRDTKLERTNHEATPKHQGNIKRFIRDLHHGHEREEREKEKAKAEVERLNGLVSNHPTSSTVAKSAPWRTAAAAPRTSAQREATPAVRKQQLAKLAEMGIAVPEDFRKEMAMAGDWQTVSERPIYESMKEESAEEGKPDFSMSRGVQKRKHEEQEDEEDAEETAVQRGWGIKIRQYPGATGDKGDELEALLKDTKPEMPSGASDPGQGTLDFSQSDQSAQPSFKKAKDEESTVPMIKCEESVDADRPPESVQIKQEQEQELPGHPVVFKKRKNKAKQV